MDDLDEILDDNVDIERDSLDYLDDILELNDEELEPCDDTEVLDDEFIESHLIPVNTNTIQNFPFVEDDIDAITDYELFSKGFGYLDDKKADKEELSEYVKKDEIPPLDDFVTKDTTELENYTLTEDLSEVALSGDYDDLSNKPVIPDVSNFVTKDTTELENYTLTSDLSEVATTGDYDDLTNKPTIPVVPTNISAFTNDSGYITKDVNDLTNYTLTSNLSSVATSGSYNDLSDKPTIPPTMTILSYGNSTWNDFINAYNSNTIVYCRASSNSNPATGSQTRLGFMAYVNNATTPTEVEFQYYRSVSSHSDSQQGDQVFVYKLTSAGTWSVTTRNSFTKIVAGTNLSSSYSSGTLTINNTLTVPTKTSDLTNDSGFITNAVNDLTNYTTTSTLTTLLAGKENSIDIGSNANGYYIKFSDGTAICWNNYSGTKDINYQIGSGYRSTSIGGGSLPITLIQITGAWANGQVDFVNENQWAWAVTNNKATTTNFPSMVFLSNYSSTSRNYTGYTFVIGKWK